MAAPRRTINANGDLVTVGNSSGSATDHSELQQSPSPFDWSSLNSIQWDQMTMLNRMLLGLGIFVILLVFGRLLMPIGMLLMLAYYASRNGSSSSSFGGNGLARTLNASRWSSGDGSNDRRGGGRSNIHGMADLPCDPKRG